MFEPGMTMPWEADSTLNEDNLQLNDPPQSPPRQISEISDLRSVNGRFQCRECNKWYNAQSKLRLGLLLNSCATPLSLKIIRKHEHTHTKPQKCHLCSTATAERKDLNRHYWVHHKQYARGETLRPVTVACHDCGEETRSDNLTRHRRRKHPWSVT